MAFDIDIELRMFGRSRPQIALQLGQVDTVRREPAKRLVKRRRNAAKLEHHGCHHPFAIQWRRDVGPRHDEESGGVVFGILGRGQQHIEAVDPASQFRGDGADCPVAARRDVLCRAGGIGMHHRCQAERAKPLAALRKSLRVAVHLDKRVQSGARRCQQMMIDALEMLAIDEQAGIGKKVVNVGDPAGDRVFDRHHGQRGAPLLDGEDHVLERGAGKHLHLRLHRLAGHV